MAHRSFPRALTAAIAAACALALATALATAPGAAGATAAGGAADPTGSASATSDCSTAKKKVKKAKKKLKRARKSGRGQKVRKAKKRLRKAKRTKSRACTARDDDARTDEGSAVEIDVLANDREPNGGSLELVAVDDSGATGSVSIAGSKISYDPAGGFEPLAEGETGSDSFTYEVENAKGKRDSAEVEVTIDGLDDPSTIDAIPGLYPEFSSKVRDYVVRCDGDPVELDVRSGPGNSIDVDGQGERRGAFSTEVAVEANQRFSIVRSNGAGATSHHVRCLPSDFVPWTFDSPGTPEHEWYVVTVGGYVSFYDRNGVPVWWFYDPGPDPASDARYLEDGTIAWATKRDSPGAAYTVRNLSGIETANLQTVGTMTDGHDVLLLANGNYLLMSYKQRATTEDLSQWVPESQDPNADTAKVVDAEIQEIKPDGSLVWSWNSKDHIDPAETDHWYQDFPHDTNDGYDLVHINSFEVTNGAIIASMRHTDSVYKIDRASGNIVWKLGGTTTPESLTVENDPLGSYPLRGQHDARILADGTVTIFDNAWPDLARAPRAVRYRIDESAGTATLLESVGDPTVVNALCCGSSRRSESGAWTVAWGNFPATNPISEFAGNGSRNFTLAFDSTFSYRAAPVPDGELSRAALRAGMDAQHPR